MILDELLQADNARSGPCCICFRVKEDVQPVDEYIKMIFSNYGALFRSSFKICGVCIKRREKKHNQTIVNNSRSSVADTMSIATIADNSSTDISSQGSDKNMPPSTRKAGPKSVKLKWAHEQSLQNQSHNSQNLNETSISTQDTENLMHSFEAIKNKEILQLRGSSQQRTLQEVHNDQDISEPIRTRRSSEDSFDNIVNRTPMCQTISFSQEQSQPANVDAPNELSIEEPKTHGVRKKRKLGPRHIDARESEGLPCSQQNENSDNNSSVIIEQSDPSFSQDTIADNSSTDISTQGSDKNMPPSTGKAGPKSVKLKWAHEQSLQNQSHNSQNLNETSISTQDTENLMHSFEAIKNKEILQLRGSSQQRTLQEVHNDQDISEPIRTRRSSEDSFDNIVNRTPMCQTISFSQEQSQPANVDAPNELSIEEPKTHGVRKKRKLGPRHIDARESEGLPCSQQNENSDNNSSVIIEQSDPSFSQDTIADNSSTDISTQGSDKNMPPCCICYRVKEDMHPVDEYIKMIFSNYGALIRSSFKICGVCIKRREKKHNQTIVNNSCSSVADTMSIATIADNSSTDISTQGSDKNMPPSPGKAGPKSVKLKWAHEQSLQNQSHNSQNLNETSISTQDTENLMHSFEAIKNKEILPPPGSSQQRTLQEVHNDQDISEPIRTRRSSEDSFDNIVNRTPMCQTISFSQEQSQPANVDAPNELSIEEPKTHGVRKKRKLGPRHIDARESEGLPCSQQNENSDNNSSVIIEQSDPSFSQDTIADNSSTDISTQGSDKNMPPCCICYRVKEDMHPVDEYIKMIFSNYGALIRSSFKICGVCIKRREKKHNQTIVNNSCSSVADTMSIATIADNSSTDISTQGSDKNMPPSPGKAGPKSVKLKWAHEQSLQNQSHNSQNLNETSISTQDTENLMHSFEAIKNKEILPPPGSSQQRTLQEVHNDQDISEPIRTRRSSEDSFDNIVNRTPMCQTISFSQEQSQPANVDAPNELSIEEPKTHGVRKKRKLGPRHIDARESEGLPCSQQNENSDNNSSVIIEQSDPSFSQDTIADNSSTDISTQGSDKNMPPCCICYRVKEDMHPVDEYIKMIFSNYGALIRSSFKICGVCIKRREKKHNQTIVNNSRSSVADTMSIATIADNSSTDISSQGSDKNMPPSTRKAGPKSVKLKWAHEQSLQNQSHNSQNLNETSISTQDTENLMHSFEAIKNKEILQLRGSSQQRTLQEVHNDQDISEPIRTRRSSEDSFDNIVNRTPMCQTISFSQEQSQPANVDAPNESSIEEPKTHGVRKKRKLGPRHIDARESEGLPCSQQNENSDNNSSVIIEQSDPSFSQDTIADNSSTDISTQGSDKNMPPSTGKAGPKSVKLKWAHEQSLQNQSQNLNETSISTQDTENLMHSFEAIKNKEILQPRGSSQQRTLQEVHNDQDISEPIRTRRSSEDSFDNIVNRTPMCRTISFSQEQSQPANVDAPNESSIEEPKTHGVRKKRKLGPRHIDARESEGLPCSQQNENSDNNSSVIIEQSDPSFSQDTIADNSSTDISTQGSDKNMPPSTGKAGPKSVKLKWAHEQSLQNQSQNLNETSISTQDTENLMHSFEAIKNKEILQPRGSSQQRTLQEVHNDQDISEPIRTRRSSEDSFDNIVNRTPMCRTISFSQEQSQPANVDAPNESSIEEPKTHGVRKKRKLGPRHIDARESEGLPCSQQNENSDNNSSVIIEQSDPSFSQDTIADNSSTDISTQGSDKNMPPSTGKAGPKSVKLKWAHEQSLQNQSQNLNETSISIQDTENLMHSFEAIKNKEILQPRGSSQQRTLQEVHNDQDISEPIRTRRSSEDSFDNIVNRTPMCRTISFSQEQSQPANVDAPNESSIEEPKTHGVRKKRKLGPRHIDARESEGLPCSQQNENSDNNSSVIIEQSDPSFSQDTIADNSSTDISTQGSDKNMPPSTGKAGPKSVKLKWAHEQSLQNQSQNLNETSISTQDTENLMHSFEAIKNKEILQPRGSSQQRTLQEVHNDQDISEPIRTRRSSEDSFDNIVNRTPMCRTISFSQEQSQPANVDAPNESSIEEPKTHGVRKKRKLGPRHIDARESEGLPCSQQNENSDNNSSVIIEQSDPSFSQDTIADNSSTDISTKGSDKNMPPSTGKAGPKSVKLKWAHEQSLQNQSQNLNETSISTQDTENLMHSFEAIKNKEILQPPGSSQQRTLQEVHNDQDISEPIRTRRSSEDSFDNIVNRTPMCQTISFSQEQSQPANVDAPNELSIEEPKTHGVRKKRKLGPRHIDARESEGLPCSQQNENSDNNSSVIIEQSDPSFSQDTPQNQSADQAFFQNLDDQSDPVNEEIINTTTYSTRLRSRSSTVSSNAAVSTAAPLRVSRINNASPPRTSVPKGDIPVANYRRNLGG